MRTFLGNPNTDKPDRRTALVARELGRYNVNIAALETCLAEEGQDKGGYTFFWSGCNVDERQESGVSFAIKTKLICNLTGLPKGINDRLMMLQLPVGKNMQATLINSYARTMTNSDDIKDKLYQELDSLIASVPRETNWSFSATPMQATRPGKESLVEMPSCNSKGRLLLRTCTTHDLLLMNTIFRQPNHNKATWMHPRSKHWHLIVYITRKADRQVVTIYKAMCGAE